MNADCSVCVEHDITPYGMAVRYCDWCLEPACARHLRDVDGDHVCADCAVYYHAHPGDEP